MAMQMGFEEDQPVMADINVTPLVDVMLVLLIIFMIAAPMLHQGIEVALPRARAGNLPLRVQDPLILSVRKDGLVYIQGEPIHPSDLVDTVTGFIKARGDESLYLQGDREVAYGRVVEILALLHEGGIKQVGLVVESLDGRRRR